MNLKGITTIPGFTKNIEFTSKLQKNKNQNNAEIISQKSDFIAQKESLITDLKRMNEEQKSKLTMLSLERKLMSGKKLTKEELGYLAKSDPKLYDKAVKIELEQEAYKKEISNAKSKKDIDKINQRYLNQLATEAKMFASFNIPKEKKADAIKLIYMQMNNVLSEHNEFVKTKKYQELSDKSEDNANNIAKIDIQDDKTDDTTEYLNNLFADFSDNIFIDDKKERFNLKV